MYKKRGILGMVNRKIYKALNANIEKKYFDTVNSGSLTNVTAVNKLSAIPAGTTDSQRVGDQCKMKNLQVKILLNAADASQTYRITLIRWNKDDSISAPTATDVYQTALSTSMLSTPFWDNVRKGDFSILYDKVHTQTLNNNAIYSFKIFRKMSSRLDFNAGGTTGKGHIYLLATSDSGAVSHPFISQYSRIVYTDA